MNEYKLSEFVENPDNPQTITDEAFQRLIEKIKKNPDGLRANRIAFVTDHPAGKRVVLSGNKRLRALKVLRGTDATAPADWFQDITAMTEQDRKEFLVNANINEGDWDIDKLMQQFDVDELKPLIGDDQLSKMIGGSDENQTEGKTEKENIDGKVAVEKPTRNFVRSFYLVSFPISESAKYVELIKQLKEKGAEIDEQLA